MPEAWSVADEPALRSDPAEFALVATTLMTTSDLTDDAAAACSDLGTAGWSGFTGQAADALGVLVQSIGVSASTVPAAGRAFLIEVEAAVTTLEQLKTESDTLFADGPTEWTLLAAARSEVETTRASVATAEWAVRVVPDSGYVAQAAVYDARVIELANAETAVQDHIDELDRLQQSFDELRDEENEVHFDVAAAEMRVDFPDLLTSPEVAAVVGNIAGVIDLLDLAVSDADRHPGERAALAGARNAISGFLGEVPAPDGTDDAAVMAAALMALVDAQAAIDAGTAGGPTYTVPGGTGPDDIVVTQQADGRLVVTVNGITAILTPEESKNVVIRGRGGNDTIDIDESVTVGITIDGGSGNDTITGGSGNDDIDGGWGNDNIDAGAGNDIVQGSAGSDTIEAGTGNDLVSGGTGDDSIDGSDNPGWIPDFTAASLPDADRVVGGSGDDSIDGGRGSDTVFGGSGDDTVSGGAGGDIIDGGGGGDKIDGNAGADVISGGSGNDYVDGGTGNDSVDAGVGMDVVYGGDGDDDVTGGDGNDYLDGGTGADNVAGGAGSDVVAGGAGDDTLNGGLGPDTVLTGTGSDQVIGANDGAVDTIYAENGDDVEQNDGGPGGGTPDVVHRFDGEVYGDSIEVRGDAQFVARVEADLMVFAQTPSGRVLLESIASSGHTVTIVESADNGSWASTGESTPGSSAPLDGPIFRERDGDPDSGADSVAGVSENGRWGGTTDLADTPPAAITFHELVHSDDMVNGTLETGRSDEVGADGVPTGVNQRNWELDATGLEFDPHIDGWDLGHGDDHDGNEPHPGDPSQNSFHEDLGIPLRNEY